MSDDRNDADTEDKDKKKTLLTNESKESLFFIDEQKTHECLAINSKERLKCEKNIFTVREDKQSYKENFNNHAIFCDKKEITLQRVGYFTTPNNMVVRSTGVTLKPKGIINKKNDCFLIATLQVLLSIKPFADYYYTANGKEIFTKAMREFVNLYNNKNSIDPENLIEQLKKKIHFMDGNEQDAHEFLVCLLNQLYKEQGGTDSIITSIEELEEMQKKNFIAKTFYGMQQNIIICNKCKKQNVGFQEMSIISCELQPNVDKVLKEYTMQERIDFKCSDCGDSSGTKRFNIVSHSKIMIIHLKRFNSNGRKNHTNIDVCREFDLCGSYYRLIGAILHHGDCESGHYFSDALRNGKWVRFDDQVITEAEDCKDSLKSAYILFYEKTNKL